MMSDRRRLFGGDSGLC